MPSKNSSQATNTTFTESDVLTTLLTYGGAQSKLIAKNPKLLKSTFDLLKSVKGGDAIAGISAVTSGVSAATKLASSSPAIQTGAKSASFVMSEFKSTMDMTKALKLTSPLAITVFVGATTIQKTGLAVSFAGGDGERAKCVGALMELAGSAAVTAVTAPTGVLLVLTAASLAASSYNAYTSCQGL